MQKSLWNIDKTEPRTIVTRRIEIVLFIVKVHSPVWLIDGILSELHIGIQTRNVPAPSLLGPLVRQRTWGHSTGERSMNILTVAKHWEINQDLTFQGDCNKCTHPNEHSRATILRCLQEFLMHKNVIRSVIRILCFVDRAAWYNFMFCWPCSLV
jgi:hypothetical protein